MPIAMESTNSRITIAPMMPSARASRLLTEAASVGIVMFRLPSRTRMTKAATIGRTKVPSRIMRSKDRSCRRFRQPNPTNRITTAATKMIAASPSRIEAGWIPCSGSAKGLGPPVGLAGAAVSPLVMVSGCPVAYPMPTPSVANTAVTARAIMNTRYRPGLSCQGRRVTRAIK